MYATRHTRRQKQKEALLHDRNVHTDAMKDREASKSHQGSSSPVQDRLRAVDLCAVLLWAQMHRCPLSLQDTESYYAGDTECSSLIAEIYAKALESARTCWNNVELKGQLQENLSSIPLGVVCTRSWCSLFYGLQLWSNFSFGVIFMMDIISNKRNYKYDKIALSYYSIGIWLNTLSSLHMKLFDHILYWGF